MLTDDSLFSNIEETNYESAYALPIHNSTPLAGIEPVTIEILSPAALDVH